LSDLLPELSKALRPTTIAKAPHPISNRIDVIGSPKLIRALVDQRLQSDWVLVQLLQFREGLGLQAFSDSVLAGIVRKVPARGVDAKGVTVNLEAGVDDLETGLLHDNSPCVRE
jgi:hypothetical protein